MFSWVKRIALFLILNFLIITAISVLLQFFNVQPYLTRHGINHSSLLVFCLIWGMTGAFISLGLSRVMAKSMMNIRIIDSSRSNGQEYELYNLVKQLSQKAGLAAVPEVGIYSSPEVNAFATGPTQKRSLVAVSSGMLSRMSHDEIEGVLGHEISHIANGDMVTMTLLQGIINAFVMFLARVLAFSFARITKGSKEDSDSDFSPHLYNVFVFLFEFIFMIFGSLVVCGYSRYREYHADSGSARLCGRDKMIQALKKLQKVYNIEDNASSPKAFQTFKISSGRAFLALFSTHPPLEKRIEHLQKGIL